MTSNCYGSEAQPDTVGEYASLCTSNDDRNVYYSLSSGSFLYYFEDKWVVSPHVGTSEVAVGINSLQICPDDIDSTSMDYWSVYTGTVSTICSIFFMDKRYDISGI